MTSVSNAKSDLQRLLEAEVPYLEGRDLTGACPPDAELKRFLANQMGDSEKQALKAHVAAWPAASAGWSSSTGVG